MLSLKEVIVVEGKYDKEKLKKITDAPIVCTHWFEIYRSKKIVNTIKALAKDRGVIILTDSDRAGFRIRNYLKQCLGDKIPVKNAYVPQIEGKERRKDKAGADGILGVEGIDDKIIEDILIKAAVVTDERLEANIIAFELNFEQGVKRETIEAKVYKAIDSLEALIQHNISDLSTWILREYELNKTYADDKVAFSEYLKELREEIRKDTLKKIDER